MSAGTWPYTFTVTEIEEDWDANFQGDWKVEGELTIGGDTYQTFYEWQSGEYGGSSTNVLLDGVEQGDDTFAGRLSLSDLVSDLSEEARGAVITAMQEAQARVIKEQVGSTQTDVLTVGEDGSWL